MNNENTSIRLKQIMKERNLRQVDLLEMVKPFCEKYNVKINKSDISQYLSGKVKPGQEKLSMLGMALNINETWLMGYDVPKEKQFNIEKTTLSQNEILLLKNFNTLNKNGKLKLIEYSHDLIETPKYVEDDNVVKLPTNKKEIWEEQGKEHLMHIACHDDNLTEEEKNTMNNIINDYIKNKQ
ncbi:DNA-binding protein [Clostridium paraputrificum]|uniref:DNA-binding protein n=1 Tax=Clostridium paraputrificum TaxID=29363 RepID=UPI001FAB88A2|nr:DNA-binding protein [Clostridium paraputrificum]MDB2108889.1 DNA-binding protein [Clostridium paraputrificum]